MGQAPEKDVGEDCCKDRLAVENFVRPGPLWWGFDWNGAAEQARRPDRRSSSRPPERTPGMAVSC